MATTSTNTIETLLARLEDATRLDDVAARIRPLLTRAVGTGTRRDALTGRRLGHPAHPAAVTVPLGCWTAATVLDIVGGSGARGAARRLVGLGVLAAGPTAASGAADWLDTRGAEQRVGLAHAAANAGATGLFALSWMLRRRHHLLGVGAGAAAMALAGAGGHLGGHLAYRRGVGVNTTAFRSGPSDWRIIDVDPPNAGDPVEIRGDGVALVAVAEGGDLHVLEDRCTHRGGPLHEGDVTDGCITCPWHGSRFALRTGAVVAGPASVPQPVYEVDRPTGAPWRVRRREPGDLRRNPVA